MSLVGSALASTLLFASPAPGADSGMHSHPVPEKLGTVHFASSCTAGVRDRLDRAVALLHSFAYDAASAEFAAVAAEDRACAIARWGVAMSPYHQLWSPPTAKELATGQEQLRLAPRAGATTPRERELLEAAAVYFSDTDPSHHAARAKAYEQAMRGVAAHFPQDDEVQIFYALALIATAPPTDRSHDQQKHAAQILEPIYRRQPDHPGAAHYLIHAYDSTELAPRGLAAARAYAKIAPAAPHALHMPSHIFTRLGLWNDSIDSNQAASRAAHEQGDVGEELHAMDYLTYAYLQRGSDEAAQQVVARLGAMGPLLGNDFKVGYAATAMPVRLAIERRRWTEALALEPLPGSAPHVAAIVYWAHAVAEANSGHPDAADAEIVQILVCESTARARGDDYWAAQIEVLAQEARAWSAEAAGRADAAIALLSAAADAEDGLEKLPVTPGPIIPAREQLGTLLLEQHRPAQALAQLTRALKDAPGRRAALEAAARAAEEAGDAPAAAAYRRQLSS